VAIDPQLKHTDKLPSPNVSLNDQNNTDHMDKLPSPNASLNEQNNTDKQLAPMPPVLITTDSRALEPSNLDEQLTQLPPAPLATDNSEPEASDQNNVEKQSTSIPPISTTINSGVLEVSEDPLLDLERAGGEVGGGIVNNKSGNKAAAGDWYRSNRDIYNIEDAYPTSPDATSTGRQTRSMREQKAITEKLNKRLGSKGGRRKKR
jgi:hypothetical protein